MLCVSVSAVFLVGVFLLVGFVVIVLSIFVESVNHIGILPATHAGSVLGSNSGEFGAGASEDTLKLLCVYDKANETLDLKTLNR